MASVWGGNRGRTADVGTVCSRMSDTQRPDWRRYFPGWPLAALMAALALDFVLAGHAVWRPHHMWGVAILLPALTLWTWARVTLGAAFTGRAEARTLVTWGPYARLRHPIYLSAELVSAGTMIFIGQFWLLLLAVVSIPVQGWRARREERVLEAAFGDAYRDYRRRTWC